MANFSKRLFDLRYLLGGIGATCFLSVAFAKDAGNAAREFPEPYFIAQVREQLALEACVVEASKAKGLDESMLRQAVLDAGQVDPLYRTVMADWPSGNLAAWGFDTAVQRSDRQKLDAIEAALAKPLDDDDIRNFVDGRGTMQDKDDLVRALDQVRLRARLRSSQVVSAGIECPIPAHLAQGADPEREWALSNLPMIQRVNAFNDCVDERFAALGSNDAVPVPHRLHARIPLEMHARIRSEVAQRLRDAGLQTEGDTAAIKDDPIDLVLLRYGLVTSSTVKPRLMASADLYIAYHQNRYLELGCTPSPDPAMRALAGLPAD